jgi:hypothetical protein
MLCDECGTEHDGEVYVHGRCHPSSPTWAILSGHFVLITCATCTETIVKLELKEAFDG